MPRLLIVADDGSERMVELTERTLQIGRGPGNDIVLADATQGVSRTHAELRFRNGRCVIVDLQSQNGTWINGQRVQHAEVPPDSEITVGNYRLRLLPDQPPRAGGEPQGAASHPHPAGRGQRVTEPPHTGFHDVPLIRNYDAPAVAAAATGAHRPNITQTILLAGFVVAVAAFAWRMISPSGQPRVDQPTSRVASEPAVDSAARAATPRSEPLGANTASAPVAPAPDERPTRPPESRGPTVAVKPDAPPVARRPGESADAWRARTAAFQTRYVYSRAALERGDFAAAAGGFEAILREEPGFMDVPQLLLQARAGLRAAAVDVFETGQRLDAAGEWLGALQKYEQARQVHTDIPGLAQAIRGVREKLRVAGSGAFNRARQFEAQGLAGDALKEYEKAVQWLPPGDPNREIARSRVEQLKRAIR